MKTTKPKPQIPLPTIAEVDKMLNQWNSAKNTLHEKAIELLFVNKFSTNTVPEEILIKVIVLNQLYSTNIINVTAMAQHITKLNIDARLKQGDTTLVNDIATGHGIKNKNGKEINFYSFATKYCCMHQPNLYPIYDSLVEKVLKHFQNGNFNFKTADLKDYNKFIQIIKDFQKAYGLQKYTLREIDIYLWLTGKKYF